LDDIQHLVNVISKYNLYKNNKRELEEVDSSTRDRDHMYYANNVGPHIWNPEVDVYYSDEDDPFTNETPYRKSSPKVQFFIGDKLEDDNIISIPNVNTEVEVHRENDDRENDDTENDDTDGADKNECENGDGAGIDDVHDTNNIDVTDKFDGDESSQQQQQPESITPEISVVQETVTSTTWNSVESNIESWKPISFINEAFESDGGDYEFFPQFDDDDKNVIRTEL
jgi:hypothetical protein